MVTKANTELALAADFIRDTGCNIFLTGKAGTGKTTFLRGLKKITEKRFIVTAPTGVAALNAGGVTLHSFFQLPIGPYLPGMEDGGRRHYRFSKEKKRIIRGLDLLVIDEVSMVRADVLDAVDATLRRHRRNERPFGGVQLLLIGDLLQLPPVVKDEERQLLRQRYDTMYFFGSAALARDTLVTVELQHIYRQADDRFVAILNQVRCGRLDAPSRAALNRRVLPDHIPEDGCVTLTTHNSKAESINRRRLDALPGRERRFTAEITGDFPVHLAPTAESLPLKVGAQVMFVRNDPSPDKLYYNGKLGVVTHADGEAVTVRGQADGETIVVKAIEWQNIKYAVNEAGTEIEEKVIGSFRQIPLKPAWAITIHKSQGLTFDRAVIDAADAFAHGQVYVALSRCRHLDGLVLTSPLPAHGIEADKAVLDFIAQTRRTPPTRARLRELAAAYQRRLLLECFDFSSLRKSVAYFVWTLRKNAAVIRTAGGPDPTLMRRRTEEIVTVGRGFQRELQGLFAAGVAPEEDDRVRERTAKASGWFGEQFAAAFNGLADCAFDTDNKEIGKRLSTALDRLKRQVAGDVAGVRSCARGFTAQGYLRALSTAALAATAAARRGQPPPAYEETDIAHPEFFQKLRDWRAARAKADGLAPFQVARQKVLIQIAAALPEDTGQLLRLNGVGPKTVEKYGDELLGLANEYRSRHEIRGIGSNPAPK